jgi:SAM-dependent methyltransferase
MDEKTCRILNAINRRFYRDSADAFSQTRQDPWPGWRRIPPLLETHLAGRDLRTLDLGCGNGRFGAFLADALPARCASLRYLGVDASEPLLTALRARRLPFFEVATHCLDVVETPAADVAQGPFSLIALIGLLHHVPGRQRRLALVRALADQLEPGGLLALAFWRFGEFERFRARRVPWSAYNERAENPVDVAHLEDGDQLLAWGAEGHSVRYCHYADERETDELVAAVPLELIARYSDDGRDRNLNRYFILRAREGE